MNATEQTLKAIDSTWNAGGGIKPEHVDWLISQLKAEKEDAEKLQACLNNMNATARGLMEQLKAAQSELLTAQALLASHETGDAMLLELLPGYSTIAEGIQALKDEITALKSDDALATAYACGMKAGKWQPIANVPRDCKVPLILWSPEYGLCVNYRFMMATEKYTWFESNGKAHRDMPHLIQDATHWQPLPQPPKI